MEGTRNAHTNEQITMPPRSIDSQEEIDQLVDTFHRAFDRGDTRTMELAANRLLDLGVEP